MSAELDRADATDDTRRETEARFVTLASQIERLSMALRLLYSKDAIDWQEPE